MGMSPKTPSARMGAFSAFSIGVGGMIGGGIYAVLGLAAQLTGGAVPLALALAGVVALLTAYTYWKLSLIFPSQGGTVEFLNRAFGSGLLTGGLSIMLSLSYVVLLSLYAYAFGAYGVRLFPASMQGPFLLHLLISASLLGLALLNYLSAAYVVRSENLLNLIKVSILLVFVVMGLLTPMKWGNLAPSTYPGAFDIMAGGMLIFLNYEGFELIANVSGRVDRPRRNLALAYFGSVGFVLILYVLIGIVALGHQGAAGLANSSDYALAAAALTFAGQPGFVAIVIAALLSTSSAINATLYGSGRIAYAIARYGELPVELEHQVRQQPVEGMVVSAVLALLAANTLNLSIISAVSSAGFLVIFALVNLAGVKLARRAGSHAWISLTGFIATLAALFALLWQLGQNPATRGQLWILAGFFAGSLLIEYIYRMRTGRVLHMGHHAAKAAGGTGP